MLIIKQQLPPLFKLAWPVVGAQLGLMLTGVVDTMMLGQLSVEALAASSIANAWLFTILWFGMGVIQGIDPLVTQAHGAKRQDHALLALQRGIVLAVLMSVPLIALVMSAEPILLFFRQSPVLASLAGDYLSVQLWSIPCFLLFIAFRQYLQGREIVQPMLWVIFIANLFNVAANTLLIYGYWGFPAMGLEGAGLASGLTRLFMLLALLGWAHYFGLIRGNWLPLSRAVYQLQGFWMILRVGIPVGCQIGLEILAFSTATFIAGMLGQAALAAHTIVLNIASLSFMVPLGIAQGAVTRVGNLLGAHEYKQAKHAAWVAIVTGGVVMLLSAGLFVLLRFQLPILFTNAVGVILIAAAILPVAAAFQVFDGIQVVCSGVLRGMGKPLPSTLANFVAFWLIGLPLGYWLAIERGLGVTALWWSLSLGLALVAVSLSIWLVFRGPEDHARHYE